MRIGAAACYSPTPCRVRYHRRASLIRVRNGTGRLTWAMAAANLLLYGQIAGVCRPVAAWEPDSGRGYVDVSSCGPTMLIAVWCRLQEEDAVQPPGVGMLVLPFVR